MGRSSLAAEAITSAAASAVGTLLALNLASAHPDIAADVTSLQYELDELQGRADFSELEADIMNLDAALSNALSLLESARDKGFKYQSDLEDIAYDAMNRWEEVRDSALSNVHKHAQIVRGDLTPINSQVRRLNVAIGSVSKASGIMRDVNSEVDRALNKVRDAESAIQSAYADIESKTNQLTSRLTRIHWALTQLEEASFDLEKDEDLVMAVAARWDAEGKDDPEGILFLTNLRIVFERKEKMATKKVLFITTASELVQRVMISQKFSNIKGTIARNKGLFSHQDFLDVEFTDSKIGSVAFHLNGQDSEEWSRLIADAKSGKIEEQRATGSGLSYTDLLGSLTTADIVEIQNEVNELQDEMMLKETQGELAELENDMRSLERELGELRARGYAIEKNLEVDIQVLATQWDRIKERAEITIEYQTKMLGEQMDSIQGFMGKLAGMSGNLASARPVYIQLKSAIASAEAQSEAAEATVLDQFDEYADEVESLSAHFDWVDWMLDAISTASFQLLATESGVAATEAIWERPGLEPENGVLFLSDQRFLWEDRVGEFELKIDTPLQQIEDVKIEREEDGDEDLIVTFGSGAPMANARFELALPVAEEWLQMVGRARSGDYAKDRAIEVNEKDLERIRNAPQQCQNCGAAFTAPVLRGQMDIPCEFCGVVTRL
jgi:predicted  nucleic acid-binding Zn-ribbon protein